jgi:Zn-finger nucleic acid-binding protein
MKCPVCDVTLMMSEKQGIEIDYCPDCRGIWLDRGELEKIIERSVPVENQTSRTYNDNSQPFNRQYDSDQNDSHGYKDGRKRNFFSELFD